MEIALYSALLIVAATLIFLVVLQGRTAGLQSSNTSSAYHTKRGLEKTIHQATIVLGVVFLILALITSLPIFSTPSTTGFVWLQLF